MRPSPTAVCSRRTTASRSASEARTDCGPAAEGSSDTAPDGSGPEAGHEPQCETRSLRREGHRARDVRARRPAAGTRVAVGLVAGGRLPLLEERVARRHVAVVTDLGVLVQLRVVPQALRRHGGRRDLAAGRRGTGAPARRRRTGGAARLGARGAARPGTRGTRVRARTGAGAGHDVAAADIRVDYPHGGAWIGLQR